MITSNLKDKGFKIEGGTTLIKLVPIQKPYIQLDTKSEKKGGKEKYRWVQTLVCPSTHKALRFLALEQDMTLGELLQEVIESYLPKKETKKCQEKRN